MFKRGGKQFANLHTFSTAIDRMATAVIVERFEDNAWQEDHITYSLLSRLRQGFRNASLRSGGVQVKWECHKLTGSLERTFGDIGVVVKIRNKETPDLEGACFLEAKKRDAHTDVFSALDLSSAQTQRLLAGSPSPMLLLYDHKDITRFTNDYPFFRMTNETHVVALPLRTAKANGLNTVALYSHAVPFGFQLCYRFFAGLDLDFSREAIQAVEGNNPDRRPGFILSVGAGIGTDAPKPKEITGRGYERIFGSGNDR